MMWLAALMGLVTCLFWRDAVRMGDRPWACIFGFLTTVIVLCIAVNLVMGRP
jgi:membrane associated rhomboid family serine protease